MFCCQAIFFAEYFLPCLFLPFIFSFCAFLFIFCCAHVPLGHSSLFIQCTPTSLLPCGTCTASSYLYRLRAAWQTSRTYVVDTWISNSLRVVGLSRVSLCIITPSYVNTAWGSEPLVFSIHLQCRDRASQCVSIGICLTK